MLSRSLHTIKQISRSSSLSLSFSTTCKPPYPLTQVPSLNLSHPHTQSDLTNALKPYYEAQTPVVLRGAALGFEAVERWKDLEYLKGKMRGSSGFVEIGGSYNLTTDRPEIPLEQYIDYLNLFADRYPPPPPPPSNSDQYLINDKINSSEIVYLAQNDLLPSLMPDVVIPEICSTRRPAFGKGKLYSVMLWLGPEGCVSPLHFDPLDNLLIQITGRKRLTLFPPTPTNTTYYPGNGKTTGQTNTSSLDVEKPDYKRYPLFSDAVGNECFLEEGDVVFIPKTWWHHVRSLEMCASVNVWWR